MVAPPIDDDNDRRCGIDSNSEAAAVTASEPSQADVGESLTVDESDVKHANVCTAPAHR
jgi:hypothetical protein